MQQIKLLLKPEVIKISRKAHSTLYRDIGAGVYVHPIKISGRRSAWLESEVYAINAAVAKGFTEEQLKELVKKLEADRQNIVVI